jgi:hypothetical protein
MEVTGDNPQDREYFGTPTNEPPNPAPAHVATPS